MPKRNVTLDRRFIARQRQRLEALRADLLGGAARNQAAEQAFEEGHGAEAREAEEEAQRLARIEIEQGLQTVGDRRLQAVVRALQKIEDGTYGFSDRSGEPIAKARLEAVPEACLTVEEEGQRKR